MLPVDLNLLNCFYFFLLMLGVFYAIMVMIAGGLHAVHLPGVHVDLSGLHLPGHVDTGPVSGHIDTGDLSGHDVRLLSLSPISIAAFVTSFGGIGIIALHGFGADGMTSLLWAVGGSIAVAAVSHFVFFYVFIAPQASSALRAADIIGQTAEVTVPIAGNSVGEIAYVAMGERHTATARSADSRDIPRGALVSIEGLAGTVIIVRGK
jgi:membrane protein implicated in regulation of membrane protease activity